jgi:hypothetical protein
MSFAEVKKKWGTPHEPSVNVEVVRVKRAKKNTKTQALLVI